MHNQHISCINVHSPEYPSADKLSGFTGTYVVRIGSITLFFDSAESMHDWVFKLATVTYAAEAAALRSDNDR